MFRHYHCHYSLSLGTKLLDPGCVEPWRSSVDPTEKASCTREVCVESSGGWWGPPGFMRVSKILLGKMFWSSFKWLPAGCSVYLHNRKQRVVLKFVNPHNLLSVCEIVRHGVPQGTVLSSLLFNVYINDFPSIINNDSHTIPFAGDTNILVPSSDLSELNSKLHSVLRCIYKWFQNNQLVLNLNTTHISNLASSKLLTYALNTEYNNRAVTVAENIKFLGLHLDCSLTWKSH
jgi:hypothetical protein